VSFVQKAKLAVAALPVGAKRHFFLSHAQATGKCTFGVSVKIWSNLLQLTCYTTDVFVFQAEIRRMLYLSRNGAARRLGFAVWYDNRASDLTKEGMREGIVQAAAFLLCLSDGVLERPFCESVVCSPYIYMVHDTVECCITHELQNLITGFWLLNAPKRKANLKSGRHSH
jgi:hypothetical protein